MEFTIKSGSPEKQRSACVVVGVFDNRKLVAVGGVDRSGEQRLHQRNHPPRRHGGQARRDAAAAQRARHARRPRAAGRPRQGTRLPRPGVPLARSASAVKLLNETGSYEAVVYLTEEKVKRREVAWRVEHAVVVAMEAVYRFEQMKSQPTEVRRPLRKLTLSVPQRSDLTTGEAAAARGLAIAHGMDFARDLGNLPGNVCTPTYLGERATQLGAEFPDIKVTVLERKEMRGARHGLVPVGDQRQRPAAALHRHGVHAVATQAGEAVRAGRQGHHVRHRRHLAQARPSTWTR